MNIVSIIEQTVKRWISFLWAEESYQPIEPRHSRSPFVDPNDGSDFGNLLNGVRNQLAKEHRRARRGGYEADSIYGPRL